jgi:hypothetical protein
MGPEPVASVGTGRRHAAAGKAGAAMEAGTSMAGILRSSASSALRAQ